MKNNKKNKYKNVYKVRQRTDEQLMKHKEIHRKHALKYVKALYPSHRLKRMATYGILIRRAFTVHGMEWATEDDE